MPLQVRRYAEGPVTVLASEKQTQSKYLQANQKTFLEQANQISKIITHLKQHCSKDYYHIAKISILVNDFDYIKDFYDFVEKELLNTILII